MFQPNASLFEACCSDRIQPFDDNEEEEDIWEDKEVNYATQAKSRTRCSEIPWKDLQPLASWLGGPLSF